MIPAFDAIMDQGVPVVTDKRFNAYCGQWCNGTRLTVTVKRRRKKCSSPQIRYYYGVICKMISEHTGHSVEEVDSILKWKFMRCVDSIGCEFIPSKMENSTIDQEYFHKRCREWATTVFSTPEHRFHIPLPNEVELEEYIPIR